MERAKCEYLECWREARYYQSWLEGDTKVWGMVCPSHDQYLGKRNLVAAGLPMEQALAINAAIVRDKPTADD